MTLAALRNAYPSSDLAAARATDPQVRALARRARARQAADIRGIASMLLGWGGQEAPVGSAGASGPGSLDGPDIDRRFVELLTADAHASLARARTELVEGFGGASRDHAEESSRSHWHELATLATLAAFHPAPAAPPAPLPQPVDSDLPTEVTAAR
jgi:hypothetical protein